MHYFLIFENVNTTSGTPLPLLSNTTQGLKSSIAKFSSKIGLTDTLLQKINNMIDIGAKQTQNLKEGPMTIRQM